MVTCSRYYKHNLSQNDSNNNNNNKNKDGRKKECTGSLLERCRNQQMKKDMEMAEKS